MPFEISFKDPPALRTITPPEFIQDLRVVADTINAHRDKWVQVKQYHDTKVEAQRFANRVVRTLRTYYQVNTTSRTGLSEAGMHVAYFHYTDAPPRRLRRPKKASHNE